MKSRKQLKKPQVKVLKAPGINRKEGENQKTDMKETVESKQQVAKGTKKVERKMFREEKKLKKVNDERELMEEIPIDSEEEEYNDFTNILKETNDGLDEIESIEDEDEEETKENGLVIVENLPHGFHLRHQLYSFFSQFSPVLRCEVDPTTNTGYVEFPEQEVAETIIHELDFYLIGNNVLRLSLCNVDVEEQEEKVWNKVLERSSIWMKEMADAGLLRSSTFGLKVRQKLDFFSGDIPEYEYVVVEQRKRDAALQMHLTHRSRVYTDVFVKEGLLSKWDDDHKKNEEKWKQLGIQYTYQE